MTWTRDRIAAIRTQPLEPVAEALGYRRDPTDRTRFKRPGSVISITGSQYFDFNTGTGGGGAIDLVLHATGGSFREAVMFLQPAAAFAPPVFEPSLSEPAAAFERPPRHEGNWPHVCRFLRTRRGLAPGLIERCHRDGLIQADRYRNAVFLCRDHRGRTTGAELVGTGHRPWRGMAAGSRKAASSFWFPPDQIAPHRLVVTESAIDALSAWLITGEDRIPTVFLSASGATATLPDWIRAWSPDRILCAYDADRQGDRAARDLMKADDRVTRLRPAAAKDWNDVLRSL